jgi:23S rRNA pseudouridine1911/1915/1917 synthase
MVDEELDGTRVDVVLSLLIPELSRSYIQKLLEEGAGWRNGQTIVSKKEKVETGDRLALCIPAPKEWFVSPQNIPLNIVYEDDWVLVVNKPQGMVVHPAPGNEDFTLVNGILHHCEGRLSTINGTLRPGIVHRIDKDTSGLLMIAKTDEAHRKLAQQLENHSITRVYHGVVYHNIKEEQGTIQGNLGRDPRNRLKQKVLMVGGRRAVTHYRVLERFGGYTYIEATLETGRTHQIRVHMAHIKHPLLGDTLYGPKKGPVMAEGQVLHAKRLGFDHPKNGERMEFESPLPESFEKILKKLRQNTSAFPSR